MKTKKLTIEEEFFAYHTEINSEGLCVVKGSPMDVFNYFRPFLKIKAAKPKIEIPEDKIDEFNQLWPEFKLPTGKYGRSSKPELKSAFQAFFKEFPDYNDWIIIMESARIYLMEREQDNWNFTRRSKYFIRRQNRDGSSEYELSDYYLRIRDGIQEVPRDESNRWEPKVY